MDNDVHPAFSSSATATKKPSVTQPTTILMPQPAGPPMPLSSIMISPLKLVISAKLRSISSTSIPNQTITQCTPETAERTLLDNQRIMPIQPTLIDEHEIPPATHSKYAVLELVAHESATFKRQTSIDAQLTPMEVPVSSSIDSPGTHRLAAVNEIFILFSRTEPSNQRSNSAGSFH